MRPGIHGTVKLYEQLLPKRPWWNLWRLTWDKEWEALSTIILDWGTTKVFHARLNAPTFEGLLAAFQDECNGRLTGYFAWSHVPREGINSWHMLES